MTAFDPASIPVALTIAGSDSGGGAGIQADLRTFSFHKVHGTSALTCITAQNTVGVHRVDALPPEAVTAQIEAIATDIGIQAAKTGMLLNESIISAVAQQMAASDIENLVVDPVMVSRAGAQLIDDEAIATLVNDLLPQALVLTPNRYEAQILSKTDIHTLDEMKAAAQSIHQRGATIVLVKGGAMEGNLRGVDVYFDGDRLDVLFTETVETSNTHGTGCTLSAAIAANLALGLEPFDAVQQSKLYVTETLRYSLNLGKANRL